MSWIVLLFGVAAVLGGVAVVRTAARGRRHSGLHSAYRAQSGVGTAERPHRHVVHYHASGALPRWDP